MATHRFAALAVGLVAVVALTGCSSNNTGFWDSSSSPCATPPPVACAPDPCAPAPCAPAPAPCDPYGTAIPSGQRPPNAQPGEVWCYVRVPAVMRTVEEQVCIQPATCRQEWVPPVTENVQEQVCVRPEEVRRIPVPAEYQTVCEQVMVCPGRTEWRKVNCEPHSLGDGEQLGECWSLVEVPPTYETRQKQVCVKPESCREEIIPAQYETRCREVVVKEGYWQSIPVPAVYESRCREEQVCPSRWEWRRTTECEVPEVTGYGDMMAPAPAPVPAPYDGGFDEPAPAPAAGGSPDAFENDTMPAPDPFAPTR